MLDAPPGGPKGSLNIIDEGTGGKFVILPPGYKDKLPAGHAPLRFDTYSGYALLRVNMADSEFVSPLL